MDKRTPSLRGEVLGADTTGSGVARDGTYPANVHAVFSIQTVKTSTAFLCAVAKTSPVGGRSYFCLIFRQLGFWKIWTTLYQNISAKETKKIPWLGLSPWACRTRVQFFRVPSLQTEQRGHFGVLCVNMSKIHYFLQMTWFSLEYSFFARFCSMLNVGRSDLRFFARKFYRRALEYLQPGNWVDENAAQSCFVAPAWK